MLRRVETIADFRQRHGGEGVRVTGALLFADGAMLVDDAGPVEPPADPTELLHVRCEFARAKLKLEEANFRSLQDYVTQQADYHKRGCGPSPSDDAVAKLHLLKPIISALRDRLAELESQLTSGPAAESPAVETLQMFTERQLSQPIKVNGRYLYSNGATSDGHVHREPPTNADAQLRLRHEYAEASLRVATHHFNNERSAIQEQLRFHQMGAGPLPQPGWETYLKDLAHEIEQLKLREQRLAKQLPLTRTEQYDANHYEQRQRAATAAQTLRNLPIY